MIGKAASRMMPVAEAALRAHEQIERVAEAVRSAEANRQIVENAIAQAAETAAQRNAVVMDLANRHTAFLENVTAVAAAFENSPIFKAAHAFDGSAIVQLARAFHENPLLKVARAFDGSIVAQLARGFENQGLLNLNAAIAAQAAGMREVVLSPQFQSILAAARTSDSFIDRMAADVATMVTAEDDEAVAAFESGFAQWIAGLPHNSLVQNFVMNLLFFVLGIWVQSSLSARTEALNVERNDRRHQAVMAAIGRLADQAQHLAPLPDRLERAAVVMRALNVRVVPELQAEKVAVLQPGQQVNLLGRIDSWIEVEYIGADAQLQKGWVKARWVKEIVRD